MKLPGHLWEGGGRDCEVAERARWLREGVRRRGVPGVPVRSNAFQSEFPYSHDLILTQSHTHTISTPPGACTSLMKNLSSRNLSNLSLLRASPNQIDLLFFR